MHPLPSGVPTPHQIYSLKIFGVSGSKEFMMSVSRKTFLDSCIDVDWVRVRILVKPKENVKRKSLLELLLGFRRPPTLSSTSTSTSNQLARLQSQCLIAPSGFTAENAFEGGFILKTHSIWLKLCFFLGSGLSNFTPGDGLERGSVEAVGLLHLVTSA